MRTRVAGIFCVAVASLLALAGCSVSAGSGGSTGTEHISTFDIDYTIEKSGTVHAVERISYDFGGETGKHGIDRYLASRFSSGASVDRVYSYDHISVSSPSGASALFSTSLSNVLQIRIGNQNATVRGTQKYVIRYDITGALNRATQDDGNLLDEFYWNSTGNNWVVPISRTTVTVHGAAAPQKATCFAGPLNSQNSCESATVKPTVATFSAKELASGEGLTIDAGYPSGTYTNTAPVLKASIPQGSTPITGGTNNGPNPFWSPLNWAIGLALLIIIPLAFLLLVVARRRDQEYVDVTPGSIPRDEANAPVGPAPRDETVVVNYSPPIGVPVGAATTLLSKSRKTVDITATLIDLAVRGHLRIEEVEGGNRRKAKDYRLVATPERAAAKQKTARAGTTDAAGLLPHESLLLGKLFKGHRTEITLSALRNTFASDMRTIGSTLDAWIENQKFFIDKVGRIHPLLAWPVGLAIPVFVLMLVFSVPFALIPVGAFIGGLIGIATSRKAIRRSARGHALYLQTLGFKDYIATAEADRIRFDETEDVFSRYMPWAIVFGEADRWAKVFKELAEQGRYTAQPDWYSSSANSFSTGYLLGSIGSIAAIGSAVDSFSALAATSMTSTPASSGSSGFSSGGGFSGGGGGGGGGGSW
ncbi:hypothetical protein BH09ACT1_BH09ACT1_02630 [soil metagenome]